MDILSQKLLPIKPMRRLAFVRSGRRAAAKGTCRFQNDSAHVELKSLTALTSGMTFGPDFPSACLSRFSTPFSAHARLTTAPPYSGVTPTPVYEYSSGSGASVTAVSSVTIIPSGLAIADPIIVAWQLEDFGSFPPDYASSLAEKIGITFAPSSVASTTPGPTNPPSAAGLSTAAKTGIGVGVVFGAAILGVAIVLLYMRKWRKAETTTEGAGVAEMEDQDRHQGERKWFFGGKWRSEASSVPTQNELDSKAVHVVPGPPAELEARQLQYNTDN